MITPSSLHTRRRRIALAALLLLTMLSWTGAALAAQLTLTWEEAGEQLGFAVERSEGEEEPFEEIGVTGPEVTAYTDAAVAEGATYCYRVRAFDAIAYSSYSNVACGTTETGIGLAVAKTGAGGGTVISEPSGVICGTSCAGSFARGTTVTLTATAEPGATFTGWGGACSGTGACTVVLDAAAEVTAGFTVVTPTLTVSTDSPSKGMVLSWPKGIICGPRCARTYSRGQAVTLVAIPATGYVFAGWKGACSGTGVCTVRMVGPASVAAVFAPLY